MIIIDTDETDWTDFHRSGVINMRWVWNKMGVGNIPAMLHLTKSGGRSGW